MKSFFARLDSSLELASMQNRKELLSVLRDTKDWIKTGNFTNYKNKMKFLMCWGESNSYVAGITGLSESGVKVAKKSMSDSLYNQLGYDFFTLVSDGSSKSIAELRMRLNLAKKDIKVSDYISKDVLDVVMSKSRDYEPGTCVMSECAKEAAFLVKYSRGAIARQAEELDGKKLRYVLNVLCGEEGTITNRTFLIKTLERASGLEEDKDVRSE